MTYGMNRRTFLVHTGRWLAVAGVLVVGPYSDGTSQSVPSSMPIGTTQSALSGRGAPGMARPDVSIPT